MRIMILAAGEGKRLRPLTNTIPKCLVQLRGKPLLEHQLELYKRFEIDDIHLIGGYQADKLLKYDVNLHVNTEYNKTNMVKTLFTAHRHFKGDTDLIISYGDIVFEENVLLKLRDSSAAVSVVVDRNWLPYWYERMENPLNDAETLKLDDSGQIKELGQKPKSYDEIQGQYIGLIKIRADHVAKLYQYWKNMDKEELYDGQDFDNMYMTTFIQSLIDSCWDVQGVLINGGWAEIDTQDDLSVATKFWDPTRR